MWNIMNFFKAAAIIIKASVHGFAGLQMSTSSSCIHSYDIHGYSSVLIIEVVFVCSRDEAISVLTSRSYSTEIRTNLDLSFYIFLTSQTVWVCVSWTSINFHPSQKVLDCLHILASTIPNLASTTRFLYSFVNLRWRFVSTVNCEFEIWLFWLQLIYSHR